MTENIEKLQIKLGALEKKWAGDMKAYGKYEEMKAMGGFTRFTNDMKTVQDEIERTEQELKTSIEREQAEQKRQEEEYRRKLKQQEQIKKIAGKKKKQ